MTLLVPQRTAGGPVEPSAGRLIPLSPPAPVPETGDAHDQKSSGDV